MNDNDANTYISVHITAADTVEAETIAQALVDLRLAACVNILPPMRSIYRWQGQVEHASEVLLIAKTRLDLFATLAAKVTELHSYDCPCIVATPLTAGHRPYLDWIRTQTSDGASIT